MMAFDYDLLVVGAGPGGLAAAKQAAAYGACVAIAEQELVGGSCVIRGCIPEKLLSFAAEFSEESQEAAGYGWNQQRNTFDWQTFIAAKEQEIHRLSQVHTQALVKAGVKLIKGHATFENAHTLEVAGQPITASKILIAVGAKTVEPAIPGIEYALTAGQLFSLNQHPKRMAILGGGYIAVKLAGIMKNLGSPVIQIIPEDHILSAFDHDMCAAVTEGITKRGIKILSSTTLKAIKRVGNELNLLLLRENQNPLIVDTVLNSIKQVPNLSGLALEKAGIKVAQGAIVVDNYHRTSQANIFAIGDCIDRMHFTPVAIAQGRAFAEAEFGNHPHTLCYKCIPVAVSSYPEAATVGLSEAQAREALGNSVRCYQSKFRPLVESLAKRDEITLIKLIVDSSNLDRVLGAHMVGEGAIDIIQCLALAIRMGVTKKDFDATIGIHPSVAEEFFTL